MGVPSPTAIKVRTNGEKETLGSERTPPRSEAAGRSAGTAWRTPAPGRPAGTPRASTGGTPEPQSCGSPRTPTETSEGSTVTRLAEVGVPLPVGESALTLKIDGVNSSSMNRRTSTRLRGSAPPTACSSSTNLERVARGNTPSSDTFNWEESAVWRRRGQV
ncbi:hypothetical protein EYF80_032399 [Liparis tanakae]|uniref:Uncharacterized protein n=1 Tax=Liparis tanakae TaxID=230148 RepID=A0A4Z2GX36_9TELE|nr:hypothetical protein EYF80_032399 [Liparis tanakae]